jgi:hypothetical protein
MTSPTLEKDYDRVITSLFSSKYKEGAKEIDFTKDELVAAAKKLKITIRNVPDVVYTYRSRSNLPQSILAKGNWIIKPKGKGRLSFFKSKRKPFVEIQEGLMDIEIPNALPEIVEKHASGDEQALLSSIRYNRLVDIFTGITCFHLQSHIRTTIEGEGQIEVDNLYVGIDSEGTEYVFPLEAKSPDDRDKVGWVQVSNMVKFAHQYFPKLKCRPIAAKPASHDKIYLIEFNNNLNSEKVSIVQVKSYKLIREKE